MHEFMYYQGSLVLSFNDCIVKSPIFSINFAVYGFSMYFSFHVWQFHKFCIFISFGI